MIKIELTRTQNFPQRGWTETLAGGKFMIDSMSAYFSLLTRCSKQQIPLPEMCWVLHVCRYMCSVIVEEKTDGTKSRFTSKEGLFGQTLQMVDTRNVLVNSLHTVPVRLSDTMPISSTLIWSSCLKENRQTTTCSWKKSLQGQSPQTILLFTVQNLFCSYLI